MKALILNSGTGSRMGDLTKTHPKCMTPISDEETILSRQLRQLQKYGVNNAIITTGYFHSVLEDYCTSLSLPLTFTFVNNPLYNSTNYIYSMYCARNYLYDDDILYMHGDLVFEDSVIREISISDTSCGVVSSTKILPIKDFKASIHDDRIAQIGTYIFENALALQPLYKLMEADWNKWLSKIEEYVQDGNVNCYAEEALNDVLHQVKLVPFDVLDRLCEEIDNAEDLGVVRSKLERMK